jgi:hypothetical protein
MPYGAQRGRKSPGEYGVTDFTGFGFAGAAGTIAALITDYQQKGEMASLYTISQWAASVGDMLGYSNIPLWMVALGLVSAGALSVFYFQPVTRRAAFAQGFSILAVLMTAIPADFAGALQSAGDRDLAPVALTREASSAEAVGGETIVAASFAGDEARAVKAQDETAQRYVVELEIVFERGAPADIDDMIRRGTLRGRLHNADTDDTFNLFATSGGEILRRGDALVIRAGVPAASPEATLWVRVECEGYAIEEQSAKVSLDQALNWTVRLQKSSTPLFLQRLTKSYWF